MIAYGISVRSRPDNGYEELSKSKLVQGKLDPELVIPMRLCLGKSTVGSELATATFDLREGVNEEMREA